MSNLQYSLRFCQAITRPLKGTKSREQSLIPTYTALRPPIRRLYHTPHPRPSLIPQTRRHNSTASPSPDSPTSKPSPTSSTPYKPPPLRPASGTLGAPSFPVAHKPWRPAPHRDPNEPVYELYFTCRACNHRSGHTISKQGYHMGTTLVKCEGCNNRHLISDHLKIFTDTATTIEDIMREKGESIARGTVDLNGDVELWDVASIEEREGKAREETAERGV